MKNSERLTRPLRRLVRDEGYQLFEHLTLASQNDPALEVHLVENEKAADKLLQSLAKTVQQERKDAEKRRRATEAKKRAQTGPERKRRALEEAARRPPVEDDEEPSGDGDDGDQDPKATGGAETELPNLDEPKEE